MEDIKLNVKRYVDMFYHIIENIIPKRNVSQNPEDVSMD
jgi:hypothetical protein